MSVTGLNDQGLNKGLLKKLNYVTYVGRQQALGHISSASFIVLTSNLWQIYKHFW